MARPCKRRHVCALPRCRCFGPHPASGDLPLVAMTVDEYECIRLMDFEGLTQAECAAQMKVARTTVQAIYGAARRKLAGCLVKGHALAIEGGAYDLCDGQAAHCARPCPRCGKKGQEIGRSETMKRVAVTYENGEIFQHFGHTEQFKVYEVEDGKIVSSELLPSGGSGHGALAGFLQSHGVDTLICGGIGAGAQNALAASGIRLYGGAAGDADSAVQALLDGTLAYQPDVSCSHHGHGEGHSCGHHGESCGHRHGEGQAS